MRVLNKVVRLTKEGLELEADPRHAKLVVKALGLEGAKESHAPGVKHADRRWKTDEKDRQEDGVCGEEQEEAEAELSVVDAWREGDPDDEMSAEDAKAYRSTVARLNYVASDRPDIQFAVKEVARCMSCPKKEDWNARVRIGKYHKGTPRLVLKYGWQKVTKMAATYTDSDWAGCSRRPRAPAEA